MKKILFLFLFIPLFSFADPVLIGIYPGVGETFDNSTHACFDYVDAHNLGDEPGSCLNGVACPGNNPWGAGRGYNLSNGDQLIFLKDFSCSEPCSMGEYWDDSTQTCTDQCPGSSPPNPMGYCDNNDCPSAGTNAGQTYLTGGTPDWNSTYCDGSCELGVEGFTADLENDDAYYVVWEYTGLSCSVGTSPGGDPGPPDEPPPNNEPPDDDNNGGDTDDDGTPDSQDNDDDGDGIPDVDDPTPNGYWGDMPSSASSSDTCLERPACSGDPIQCHQLQELWRLRCLDDSGSDGELLEEVPDGFSDGLLGNLDSDGEDLIDQIGDGLESELENYQDNELGLNEGFLSQLETMFDYGSCSNHTVTILDNDVVFDCSRTQPIRTVGSWFFTCLTVIYVLYIALNWKGKE